MNFDPVNRIDEIVWGDTLEKHGLAGRIGATALRYLYAVLRDFFSGQLTLRAMGLVYTTLLSIIPLLALSFSVLKGFGVDRLLEDQIFLFFEPLGEKGDEYATQLLNFVGEVNGRVLGSVGLAVLMYTAISMVQKIEESFNYVWYVSNTRSFARRFTEYFFVLLIVPVVIVMALGMLTTIQNEGAVQWLLQNQYVGQLFVEIGKLTPYVMVVAVFTFLYIYMPNTNVRLPAALVGGIAGGVMWATLSAIFTAFVVGSNTRHAMFAGLAIPIATLLWLYLNWLVLLVGAQLAFYCQNPAYLRIGRRDPRLSNSIRERLALNIMFLVGEAFRDPKRSIRFNELAEEIRMPTVTIAPIAVKLERAGLLTLTEEEELQPGRDINRIKLGEILDVVRYEGETGSHQLPVWATPVAAVGAELDAAVSDTLGEKTLAELLDSAGD